jgi:predicted DNA-binding transcriptional regulator AlpA
MIPFSRQPPCADDVGRLGAGNVIESLLSIDDLIRILGCSRRLLERMRAAGKLPHPDIMIGRMPRWKAETIRDWIERRGRQ